MARITELRIYPDTPSLKAHAEAQQPNPSGVRLIFGSPKTALIREGADLPTAANVYEAERDMATAERMANGMGRPVRRVSVQEVEVEIDGPQALQRFTAAILA